MSETTPEERFLAPGFTHPDGSPAYLYSAHNPKTVLRHFQWMRDYGIDGVWLQRFLVALPGAPVQARYRPIRDVMNYVQDAAGQTGRVWAIAYDTVTIPDTKMFDLLTADWKRMVDEKVVSSPRYLHEGTRPVVQVWWNASVKTMTPEVLDRIIAFFKAPGPYQAYVVAGGGWNWRALDQRWRDAIHHLDACTPWNAGNRLIDKEGIAHPNMRTWAEDKRELDRCGTLWIPVIYPGFSWNNNQQKPWVPAGIIPRRGGKFLWEQFYELSRMGVDTVCVAMFDELDEGTQILKVTNTPPTQAHFLTYEGLPSDWYLRLVGRGEQMLRQKQPIPAEIPIHP
jgi:hypothetical protein